MNKYRQQFIEWFNARNERERVLITVVSIIGIISLWMVLITDPQSLQREQLRTQLENIKNQEKAIQIQIAAIIDRSNKDPNIANENKIAQLQKDIESINENLKKKMKGFVDPNRMANVLEDVLKHKSNLELIRLESLPAEYIFAGSGQNYQDKPKTGLYRHGIKMEMQGSYLNTLEYLSALEDLDWDFYWDGLEVEIVKYPQAKVILYLHTLSLKEGWIGV